MRTNRVYQCRVCGTVLVTGGTDGRLDLLEELHDCNAHARSRGRKPPFPDDGTRGLAVLIHRYQEQEQP